MRAGTKNRHGLCEVVLTDGRIVPFCDTRRNMCAHGGLPAVLQPEIQPAKPASCGIVRPSAAFIAQLVATAQRVPQTRARRQAGSDHATALYAAIQPPERVRVLERLL